MLVCHGKRNIFNSQDIRLSGINDTIILLNKYKPAVNHPELIVVEIIPA